jgi:signal transduction histidine kinase
VAVDQTSDMRRIFDCRLVTEEVVATLRPLTRHRAIDIQVDVPEGLLIDSYPGAYGQIITNLMTNAVTHGLEGRDHGLIRLAARRRQTAQGQQVEVLFGDDGRGIPSDLIQRVFDPFVTTKLGTGGSGLGLHIVYTLVTQVLGGRVTVKSEVGGGTTFTIVFPPVAPEPEAEA